MFLFGWHRNTSKYDTPWIFFTKIYLIDNNTLSLNEILKSENDKNEKKHEF